MKHLPDHATLSRVIGADGSLARFGGELDIKRKLLTHEGLLLALSC